MKDEEIEDIHDLLDRLILLTTGRNAIDASWKASDHQMVITYTLEPPQNTKKED